MSLKTSKITLVKNKKLDCIYHKDSMLVFKSANEKLVIGRIENDEIIPLDEKALELCETHGFKYDESLVETEDATSQGNTESQEPENTSENSTEPTQPVPPQPVAQQPQPVVQPPQPVTQPPQPVTQQPQPVVQNSTSESVVKQFEDVVNGDAESLVNYFRTHISGHLVNFLKIQVEQSSEKLQQSNDRVSELEGQVVSLRKELDETKKKMRGILAAIQADL